MDLRVSKRVDWVLSGITLGVLAAAAGHVFMPELEAGIQWLITEILEPTFGLNELVLS